jgi:hypothetical protein
MTNACGALRLLQPDLRMPSRRSTDVHNETKPPRNRMPPRRRARHAGAAMKNRGDPGDGAARTTTGHSGGIVRDTSIRSYRAKLLSGEGGSDNPKLLRGHFGINAERMM